MATSAELGGLGAGEKSPGGDYGYQDGFEPGKTCSACCLYNCVFSPVVLIYHAIRIYFCSCLAVHLKRGFLRFCCFCCHACDYTCYCCGIIWSCLAWSYVDRGFPPSPCSLGNVGGDSAASGQTGTSADSIIWIRAGEFGKAKNDIKQYRQQSLAKRLTDSLIFGKMHDSRMQLYQDGVSAKDILQGKIGDCWLMAAMACMAERPGAIDNLFISKEFDPRGKYTIQLFDGTADRGKGAWRHFTIDDFIPCDKSAWENGGKARPKFAQPNGDELWVLLLEKAFAKLCGSYANLEGGSTIWALRAMTGDHCRWYEKDKSGGVRWKRWDFVNLEDPRKHPVCKDKRNGTLKGTNETLNVHEMWHSVFRYNRRGSVLCASGAQRMDGLVSGHAYSILDAYESKEVGRTGDVELKLVRIRNPWGSGEWKGDWSDKSEKWNEFPNVKKKIYVPGNDGSFWMEWHDYCSYWDRIGIADRTKDIHSLHMEYNQSQPYCGPTRGMLNGCYEYWCCMMGCRRLYCPKRSGEANIAFDGQHNKNMCGCRRSTIADRI
eukprot:g19162.t1